MNINTILVALDSDPESWLLDDALIKRAALLGQKTDAELVLLSVNYDSSLGYGRFASRAELDTGRLHLLTGCRERQENLRQMLQRTYGLKVSTDTLWDPDRVGSILRHARSTHADLIMKASEGHAFLLGLFSNTDWDLLRESPLPVWFVADDEAAGGPANGVIAAVDQYFPDDEDECESFQLDNEAFNTAKRLSDRYAASLYAVHAYQVPRMLPGFEGYTPMLGPSSAATATAADLALTCHDRAAIARRHGQVVQDFVDEHGIPVDDLIVKEGEVWQVLSEAAESRSAGLIVMGSSKKSWWDRLRGRSNAEPTLSRSSCDVLFVKAEAESQ